MSKATSFKIAQMSDLHFGDPRFDHGLMDAATGEINQWEPDLLIVAGDLTAAGYREQFEDAHRHLGNLDCEQRIVIAGNHDCQNVGNLFFEELFGARYADSEYDCPLADTEKVTVVAVDSNKPDLADGEIGRDNYRFIHKGFSDPSSFNVFILHHHLVTVPGTGRERNIVWDAGDVLQELVSAKVDLVLSGHKHVPYVWRLDGMYLVTSGTVSTHRTRGPCAPAYNMVEIFESEIVVSVRTPGVSESEEVRLPRGPTVPMFAERHSHPGKGGDA